MPIYEYACPKCGHEFEQLLLAASARDEVACPACGGNKVTRKMSVFSTREGHSASGPPGGAGPCGRCGAADGPCPLAG